MTSENNFFSGNNVKQFKKREKCTLYQMKNDTGEGVITLYQVIPGIEIIYMDINMQTYLLQYQLDKEVLEIVYCNEGNVEWELKNGTYMYCQEGDIQIIGKEQHPVGLSFPLNHYHGVVIAIYIQEAKKTLSKLMNGYSIDLDELQKKFCSGRIPFSSRAQGLTEHIFSDFYQIPDKIRENYFKLKVMELLLILSETDIREGSYERDYFSKTQVEKVKAIKEYVSENLNHHFTLNQLSETFDISPAFLKRCFQGVYGMSVDFYIRSYRIQAAAALLRENTENITTIAGMVGYNNPSKFAAAFKKVMGMTPKKYQKSYMQ